MLRLVSPAERLLLAVCLLLLSASFSFAQITNVTDDTSVPIPGAGHDYIGSVSETVNPANGSLSLRIGLPVPKGRKLTIPFGFAYDSNGASHPESIAAGTIAWYTNLGEASKGGWSYTVPVLSEMQGEQTVTVGSAQYHCFYSYDYVLQDPSGGRHPLYLSLVYNPTSPGCQNAGGGLYSQLSGTDGVYQGNIPSSTSLTASVVDPDGTVYQFPIVAGGTTGPYNALPMSIEDRNGNRITIADQTGGAFTYTDTLGRTAISSSGFGASGNTVAVSGIATPYTLAWRSLNVLGFPVNSNLVSSDGKCPAAMGNGGASGPVVSAITLPNGQYYLFGYDSTYGLVNSITYPTGELVTYTWGLNSQAEFGVFADTNGLANQCEFTYGMPAVQSRKVYFDGTTLALEQDFTYTTHWSTGTHWDTKSTTVRTTSELGGSTPDTIYNYSEMSVPLQPLDPNVFGAQIPLESSVTEGNLRTTNKVWWGTFELACQDVTLTGTPSGSPAMTLFYYGSGSQLTGKYEYDFGTTCAASPPSHPPTTSLLRQTIINYASFAATPIYPSAPSIFDRPSSVIVCGAISSCTTSSHRTETDYVYDGTSPTGGTGFSNHDDVNYGLGYNVRGNATSKTQQCLSNCSSAATTHYAYDATGQQISMTDPNVNPATTYSYNDGYDGYLTKISGPLQYTLSYTYNHASGTLASSTDQNSQVTSYYYNDSLGRLTEVDYPPDGGKTTYTYNDGSPTSSVVTSQSIDPSTTYITTEIFDGAGHVTRTQLNTDPDCSGGIDNTDTSYNGVGSPWTVSNPYCSGAPDPNSTGNTVYQYDSIGRVVSVQAPDQSMTNITYPNTSVAPLANCTKTVDPQLHARQSCTDALGRMFQVTEDPNGLNYQTTYTYDALENLLTVSQGSQTRTFVYDSLSRLSSATNPESSLTQYSYDKNGNVLSKTDGRNVVTTYCPYDALNRVVCKSYSDSSTPTANFYYDEASVTLGSWTSPTLQYPVGRLTHTTTVSGGTTLTATVQDYDTMGRTKDYWQCTPSNCGTSSIWGSNFQHKYTGEVYQWTHPAPPGYTYTNTISAARRITQISSSQSDSVHPPILAQNIHYTPWGALSSLQNGYTGSGANAQETYEYNKRLQPAVIELGTSASQTAYSCLVYDYYGSHPASCSFPASGTNNNGNVQWYWYNDNWQSGYSHTMRYSYDAVNRLSEAKAQTPGGGALWDYSYTYDQWGNAKCSPSGMDCPVLTYSTNNNRLLTISTYSFQYDGAGNMTYDPSNTTAHTYQWDAEGRVSKVDPANIPPTWIFTYNALGHRVQFASPTMTEQHVFDPDGNWLGLANSSTYTLVRFGGRHLIVDTPTETYFHHVNALSSTSMMTNHAGNPIEDVLFYPWGDVWGVTGSGGYSFAETQYYDLATTTALTTARVLGVNFGRWFSPDPAGKKAAQLDDPQTWNMYAYVRNNPTTLVDPEGESIELTCSGDDPDQCAGERQAELQALQQAVGTQAGSYLYENPITTTDPGGNSTTRYYVGIYSGGPSGNGPAFDQVNSIAGEFAPIINDTKNVQLAIARNGQTLTDDIGNRQTLSGQNPGWTSFFNGNLRAYIVDPSTPLVSVPDLKMFPPVPGVTTPGILVGHELGHARAVMTGSMPGLPTFPSSLRIEDKIRTRDNPNAPIRMTH